MLTVEIIEAAQNNDLDAVATVVRELDPMVVKLAGRIGTSANRDDLAQTGREALWKAIGRFSGGNVDNFRAFMYRTVEGAMLEEAQMDRMRGAGGVKRDDIKVFAAMVKRSDSGEGPDLDLAEELAQTYPDSKHRLSATRARAARMAYEGMVSVDFPVDGGATLENLMESTYGIPGIEQEEDRSEAQKRKEGTVRAVIRSMGPKQAAVLRARWGIEAPCLGSGAEADEILAEALNTTPGSVRALRSQAHKAFAKRYSKITGIKPCDCTRCAKYRKAQGISL